MHRIGDAVVVSPSEHVRLVSSAALASWGGVRVHPVSTRPEAMRTLGSITPGFCVIDCDMPDAMVVAAACYTAGVPFLTINDDHSAAAHAGARACISRPFNAARLIDALDVTIGLRARS